VGAIGILAALALSSSTQLAGESAGKPTAAASSSLPGELEGAVLIDSVVARVNRHPITQSQLDLEARLAFAEHGELAAAQGTLSEPQLSSALDYLIDQLLLEDEAERLQVFEIDDEEIRKALKQLAARFSPAQPLQAFLDLFGVSSDTLETSLRRGLRAERYLDNKIRVQVQGGTSPTEAQQVAKDLVAQLRARADIRLLASFKHSAASLGQGVTGSHTVPAAATSGP
jgi:hypothetical protein